MPAKIVAAQLLSVRLGEGEQLVGGAKTKRSGAGRRAAHFMAFSATRILACSATILAYSCSESNLSGTTAQPASNPRLWA